ncbi:Pyridine nucleotide-disulphide oxidoreductase [Paracidovorax cattleyae]|uniref:Pyridine nucleotide-disulphide oxidoreductase n=2 Tax=Paracidovorax cattleyae TaxID=80868 RepID=A0A1H0MD36_9BURK|nr:Pyridine nucleotide-disulphide oxidoreductase [Paracidovorax cattleyae]
MGKHRDFSVTLIDKVRTHVWKPKLHEIAAGTMDIGRHEVGFLAHARSHGFKFRMGEMIGLDREAREVSVAPYVDLDGEQVTPARKFGYDTLVFAVGSQSNEFGTPGVKEHALRLDRRRGDGGGGRGCGGMFLDFEADRMLDGRHEFKDDWTAGYRTYLRYGLLQTGKGQSHLIDSILRRSQWCQRHRLHGEQDLAELRQRLTVAFERQADLFESLESDTADGDIAALAECG